MNGHGCSASTQADIHGTSVHGTSPTTGYSVGAAPAINCSLTIAGLLPGHTTVH